MKTLSLIALAVAGTLAFSFYRPKDSQEAGARVIQATKKAGAVAEEVARESARAIHKATAENPKK